MYSKHNAKHQKIRTNSYKLFFFQKKNKVKKYGYVERSSEHDITQYAFDPLPLSIPTPKTKN